VPFPFGLGLRNGNVQDWETDVRIVICLTSSYTSCDRSDRGLLLRSISTTRRWIGGAPNGKATISAVNRKVILLSGQPEDQLEIIEP